MSAASKLVISQNGTQANRKKNTLKNTHEISMKITPNLLQIYPRITLKIH